MYDFYDISNIDGYETQTFNDVYPDVDTFKNGKTDEYGTKLVLGMSDVSALYVPLTAAEVTTLYYLLCARYGNSPIANMDQHQFSIKLFSIIYQYGPNWAERVKLQDNIRKLSIDQLKIGSKAIHNTALNPGEYDAIVTDTGEDKTTSKKATTSTTELAYIDTQNTTNYVKSDIEAISLKWDMLEDDITERFLKKFQYLFLQIARPTRNIYYGTED